MEMMSAVRPLETFRIALTEKSNLLIKQNITKAINFLFYYHPLTQKIFSCYYWVFSNLE